MSHLAQQVAWSTALEPTPKLVLVSLAWHACNRCGLAWPGVGCVSAETGLGKTAVREALEKLKAGGQLVVFRFPHGGRGLSTEYIVLPQIRWLSTAPCGECRLRMKNPPGGGAFDKPERAKATGRKAKTHRTGGDQQSTTEQQSGLARSPTGPTGPDVEPPIPPPPLSEPPPLPPPQSPAEVKAYVQALAEKLHLRSRP